MSYGLISFERSFLLGASPLSPPPLRDVLKVLVPFTVSECKRIGRVGGRGGVVRQSRPGHRTRVP